MLFWPLKTNVSLLKFSGLITSNYRSVYISMSTGRISPVLCSFTHSSLSLAGSTFRSNWSTSSTVWKEENKNPNVKGTLQAESHCSDMQSGCGHAYTASAGKGELHVQETGWTRQVWTCSLVVSRGDLTWRSRDRFPVPGSSQAASDSSPVLQSARYTKHDCTQSAYTPYILIFDKRPVFNKEKIYIYSLFQQWNNSASSLHKRKTSRNSASCWES